MITMKGAYNSANIMIDDIDVSTKEQIQGFLNNPSFFGSYIAIMPDCHKGNGSCIGFTMKMNTRIIPDIVGVDIGCGMLSSNVGRAEWFDPATFDRFVKREIPYGFSVRKTPAIDTAFGDVMLSIVNKIKMDKDRVLLSIGTLGGGNHFIEAGRDSNHDLWITIHSGSRNFGLQIANYHGRVAKEICASYGSNHGGMPFLLVDSPEGQDYLNDMRIAQKYASLNRFTMMNTILNNFHNGYTRMVESIHNFIGDDDIIRKGATSANEGEDVLIPFNMRDGIALCKGKGSSKYNNSAPHGAGRILSRTKAKATLDVDSFVMDMREAGVYTSTANIHTLDEAPGAYKDKEIILANIKETVDVVDFIRPIYNFKAGGE